MPAANNAATVAAMTRMLSSAPIVGAAAGAGLCAAGAGRACETGAAAAEEARGAGAAGAADGVFAALGNGTALGAPVGPPGGSVGNLIVGAADGLGGKLMRTVSFLG